MAPLIPSKELKQLRDRRRNEHYKELRDVPFKANGATTSTGLSAEGTDQQSTSGVAATRAGTQNPRPNQTC
nr:unnamed protein product [Callosobruchus chinensis]